MELTSIASIDEWGKFEKEIHDRSGMNACVYNNQGNRITSYAAFANEVCPLIKSSSQAVQAICSVVNQYFISELAKTKEPLVDACDAGFVKFAVPIVSEGAYLGSVVGCGHLLADAKIETFLIEKAIGKDNLNLEQKSNTVKTISANEVDEMIVFVQNYLANLLSKKNSVWHECVSCTNI